MCSSRPPARQICKIELFSFDCGSLLVTMCWRKLPLTAGFRRSRQKRLLLMLSLMPAHNSCTSAVGFRKWLHSKKARTGISDRLVATITVDAIMLRRHRRKKKRKSFGPTQMSINAPPSGNYLDPIDRMQSNVPFQPELGTLTKRRKCSLNRLMNS